jgi:small subunit ribosomal protein S20
VRSATRTQIRKALPLIEEGRLQEAEAAVREAVKTLDKAAEKGIIHPNNAARRKSRLVTKYATAATAAAAAPEPSPPKTRARRKKATGS